MAQNLREAFEEAASKYPDEAVIEYKKDGKWAGITYGGFRDNVRSLRAYLAEQNVKKNDTVAILMENRPEWPLVFFAVAATGAISVPIDPASSRDEIETILKDSECRLAFTGKDSLAQLEDISKECPSVQKVISVDSDIFKSALKRPSEQIKEAKIDKDDLACILYTSGTTDIPKGVMLTHGNLLSNCESLFRSDLFTQKDSVVSILPLHHTYPLTITMILPVFYGGRIIYPGGLRDETIMEAMRETDPTVFVAVPQIFYMFYKKMTEALKRVPFPLNILFNITIDLLYKIRGRTGVNLTRYFLYGIHRRFGRSMRLFASGGAKLDENVAKALFRLGFTVLEGYGLTETSPVLTFNPLESPRIGSVGIPIADVELKIADKNEEGVGEVIARGPNVMKGYYKKPDMTDEVIKDGWFHTGDLGYFDKDGYLFLTGRTKEVIVLSSGINIYPEEIEDAYSEHAPVKEMCVFEAPFKKKAEDVMALWAVVVPDLEFFKKYGEVNLRSVIKERFDNVSRTLPPPKRLMGFYVTLDDLPRTLLGKIKRYAVKDAYAAKLREEGYPPEPRELSEEDKELMEKDLSGKIVEHLKKQTGIERPIVPGDLLELDLGIDSLGRVELASGLESALGLEIKDEIVGKAFTVRDLIMGIEPLLPAGGGIPAEGEIKDAVAFDREKWRKTLQELPRKENLEKIDLEPGPVAWLAAFTFTCMVKAFFLFYNLKVEGKKNFPKEGPYILFVNHTSYFDGFLVAAALPDFPRLDLFFVGFRPYFVVPILRNLVKVGRIIPLDFSSHLLEAMKSCYYVLQNGKNLCLFPEGLRTLDGRIGKFKKGFGILTKETQAKLVPVLIEGAFEAWPRTSKFPKRHPIKVTFGKPLDPAELEKKGLEKGAEDGYTAICLSAREALVKLKK